MAADRKIVVIANPQSQGGALGKRWPVVERLLREELGPFEAHQTRAPRDAVRLCRAALADGADVVCALGGDGTTHEVVNGFFDDDGAPLRPDGSAALGLLPYGTGGDFRKTAGVSKDLAAAAAVIRAGKTRVIDVGWLAYQTPSGPATTAFINIASFGIGGLVDRLVNQSGKRLGGKVSFFLATARAALSYKNQPVELVFDDDDGQPLRVTINNVAVANGRYFGGGMFIAPQAELDDAQFDVVIVGDLGVGEMIRHGGKLYAGTHLSVPKIVHRRCRTLTARPAAGNEVLLDVDGEALGALPATFTVKANALTLLAPAE
jgi:diacylglycerol kinase (ATP)